MNESSGQQAATHHDPVLAEESPAAIQSAPLEFLVRVALRMAGCMSSSISEWIVGMKAGDESAVRRIWNVYCASLLVQARRWLGHVPRRVADEEDVVANTFEVLFRGAREGRFSEMQSREDLWRLLLQIARHKVRDELRRNVRQKRGGGRVRGDSALKGRGSDPGAGFDVVAGDARTPEFLVAVEEQLQRLLAELPSEDLRTIAVLRMEGNTHEEIALERGTSVRTIERKCKMIRDCWEAKSGSNDSA